jgi:hypothetical protein
LAAPTTIKAVEPLDVNDRGEVVLRLSSAPTEEFIHGAKLHIRNPGSRSTAYDSRAFERFEGTTMIFKRMAAEVFQEHYLPVALDAIKAGNETATGEYERREAEAAQLKKANMADQERIEAEKAKAAKVKFE